MRKNNFLKRNTNLKKLNEKVREQKAITLIALVITIIVLLILASVSIAMLTGENGIIGKAKTAAEEHTEKAALEKLNLKLTEYTIDQNDNINPVLKEYLEAIDGCSEVREDEAEDNIGGYIVVIDDYEFTINKELAIIDSKYNNEQDEEIIDDGESTIIEAGVKYQFEYTGNYEKIKIKNEGYYNIECVGAGGGFSRKNGGVGAYGGLGASTSGKIYLNKGDILYIYIGGKGTDAVVKKDAPGGYNGGGLGTWDRSDDEAAGAGGGATDVRLVVGSESWSEFESLKSRIMVAGGGSGAVWTNTGPNAGGLEGYPLNSSYSATQTTGWKFGIGQDGSAGDYNLPHAGAGGGYYGGKDNSGGTGSGGSSYISGYEGCNSIDKDSTEENIIHTNQEIHYSGRKFLYPVMEVGKNSGNGYATIEYIGNTVE